MATVNHSEVVEELERRGFDTSWVGESERDMVERELEEHPDAGTVDVLDWLEVEGQVTDGLFEDPSKPYDFTLLLTKHSELVGRMMYFMLAFTGGSYTYEDLVDDVEYLAKTEWYDAPFDRERALEAEPSH